MKNTIRILLGLGLFWVATRTCLGQQNVVATSPTPKITIYIYNYSNMSAQKLAKAEKEASRIFGNAGLESDWVLMPLSLENPPEPAKTLGLTDIVLRLQPQKRGELGKRVMGEALSFQIVNVFMSRVMQESDSGGICAEQVLGHAMAHEIGHLLLGANSHSQSGIMVARWTKPDFSRMSKGDLLFRREEAEHMRAEVLRRNRGEGPSHLAGLK